MTQNNLELMRTLDDSWNAQDWHTFEKRHSKDTTVFWPGQAEPTRGRDNHKAESVEFFKTFPDNHLINHPYRVEIAQGEWTCTVADFTGTMRGSIKGPPSSGIFTPGSTTEPRTNRQEHPPEGCGAILARLFLSSVPTPGTATPPVYPGEYRAAG